jgi:uncharacterized membrane protein
MIRTLQQLYSSRPRLFIALGIGVVATFAIPLRDADPVMHALVGWNVAVYLYLIIIWIMMLRADDDDVRGFAKKQDEKAYVILIALSLAALMSLVAIVIELAGAGKSSGERPFHIAMTGLTVIGSWFLIPTVFGLHYAHEYYKEGRSCEKTLLFPGADAKPDYWDFMYFSFTIAVAFATSDVQVVTRATRKLVLVQSVLAFFFNASILALSINISASLVAG